MHPLVNSFADIKDAELESKIGDLTKKYFMTHNVDVRSQIAMLLESYREELGNRRAAALDKMMNSRDKSLDKLINID